MWQELETTNPRPSCSELCELINLQNQRVLWWFQRISICGHDHQPMGILGLYRTNSNLHFVIEERLLDALSDSTVFLLAFLDNFMRS